MALSFSYEWHFGNDVHPHVRQCYRVCRAARRRGYAPPEGSPGDGLLARTL